GAYVDALDEVIRRRRLAVRPATLVEWMHRVGVVKTTGKSGEHSIEVTAAQDANASSPFPPKASGEQPVARRAGISTEPDGDELLPPTESAKVDEPKRRSPRAIASREASPDRDLMWNFRPGELPGQLFELAVQRVTGKLHVRHEQREKTVYFV